MSSPILSRTVQSSELSRNAAEVFRAVEDGPVIISRRDGEPLILSKASEVSRQQAGIHLAAQLVAVSLAPGNVPFAQQLREPFPWVEFLRQSDQDAFAQEIVDVARACASVSRFDRLLLTVQAWRDTAEAVAAGYTADDDLDWLEQPHRVPDPRRT